MSPGALDEVINWPEEKKQAEWAYMQNTIRSSWEFSDYIFLIEDVSRAFTHQLVRHRVGTSFAQQSQRTVDMSGFEYVTSRAIAEVDIEDSDIHDIYDATMGEIKYGYDQLIKLGAKPEDARGVLPTNICTNIIFKANLRTLSQMCGERLCVKAQGEFQDVMKAIRETVISIHPWAEPALRVHCAQTGVCCFPSVTNCKIKDETFNPATAGRYDNQVGAPLTKEQIQLFWEDLDGRLAK
jgi:flavin-dependent thymidylate synthase